MTPTLSRVFAVSVPLILIRQQIRQTMYHPLGSLVTVYHENGRANFEGIVSGFELETNSYKIFVNGEHVSVKSELIY